MLLKWLIVVFALGGATLFADSPYVFLFQSSHARAVAGLARQRARRTLAQNEYQRAVRIVSQGAMSAEEYDHFRTAAALSAYDLEIAEIREKEEAISLRLALGLARRGSRIPLCKRKKRKDENTVSAVLKATQKYRTQPKPLIDFTGSGTQLDLAKAAEETAPPPPVRDVKPPEAPDVPVGPGVPSTPPVDFDVPTAPRSLATPPKAKPPAPKPKPPAK